MAKSNESTDSITTGTTISDTVDNDDTINNSGGIGGSGSESTGDDSESTRPVETSDSGIGDPTTGVNTRTRKRNSGGSSDNGTSGKSRAKTTRQVDLNRPAEKIFATQLVGAHKILGLLGGNPALWEITNEQGAALSDAILEVMNQYKIKPNPKVVAWMNLVGVCSVVYGTKVVMYKAIQAHKRQNHKPPEDTRQQQQKDSPGGFQMQYA